MEEANKANMSLILNMLPPEMVEKILKLLKLKETRIKGCFAAQMRGATAQ